MQKKNTNKNNLCVNIDINIDEDKWQELDINLENYINSLCTATISNLSITQYCSNFEISILLSNDQHIKKLNKEFRRIDKATDILSFPAHFLDYKEGYSTLSNDIIPFSTIKEHEERGTIHSVSVLASSNEVGSIVENCITLGDIIIAYDYSLKDSQKDGKKFIEHFAHLLVHGVLHLLGFDHICEEDAAAMENMEKQILSEFGIKNPYYKH